MTKTYDRAYYDRWYREPETRVHSKEEVRRKVAVPVALAEYFLQREIRTVLDIGAGEGAWLPHLRAMRPGVKYLGLDPSDYAVRRWGRTRNIRKAAFADLPSLKLGVYDLVVCSDVLHYVSDKELRAAVPVIARVTDGLAFLDVLTREDDIIGDLDGLLRRSAAWYRKLFTNAGMQFVGPNCWLGPGLADSVAAMETPR